MADFRSVSALARRVCAFVSLAFAVPFAVAAPACDATRAGHGGESAAVTRAVPERVTLGHTKRTQATPGPARHADAGMRGPVRDPRADRVVDIAGVGEVVIYAPRGQARGLALFASGDGGWQLGVREMANVAAGLGYWVAGFSTPAFLRTLENGDGGCSNAADLLDRFGTRITRELELSADWRPILIGYSSGATLMYAALAQAGDERFGGALTLGFCPDLVIHRPFCAGAGLSANPQVRPPHGVVFNTVPSVPAPWIVLQGDDDKVCNPPATAAFVGQVRGAQLVMLHRVGHGYSVPKHWMPQFRKGLIDLLSAARPPHVADVRR